MAIVRPQRAAIEELLARSKEAGLARDTLVTTAVHGSETFHVAVAGVSNGDTCYHSFQHVPVVVFNRASRVETARVQSGAVCVLDEPVDGGPANERAVHLLRAAQHGGITVFRVAGKPAIYREI